MTGNYFLGLWAMFDHYGIAERQPEPGFVDRTKALALRFKAWRSGLPEAEVRDVMLLFGGTLRLRDLDERAFSRVMIRLGSDNPEPAPCFEGVPGMVTQPQANLIWKLWHDAQGRGGDVSEAALGRAIGAMLGLPGRLLAPVMGRGLAA